MVELDDRTHTAQADWPKVPAKYSRLRCFAGTPAWPAHDATDPVLVLDRAITTATAIRAADCDFWAPFYDPR